jgi:hypothetical protein
MRASALFLLALSACATNVSAPQQAREVGRITDGEADFQAYFCPDDDTIGIEVAEIGKVIDARLADPGTWADGDNPYRIRYAVYNLRNDKVVDALVQARDAGVDVQVLVEDGQLDPERDWNWADEYLIDHGFAFAPDHRDLSADELDDYDLIGIGGSGLMHLKTRLFETPQRRALITGSMNPGDNAVFNEETFHLVLDERIIDRYVAAYDAVVADVDFDNVWDDDQGVNVLFSPERSGPAASTRILEWLQEEDEQILLMVFTLRDLTAPGVTDSLVDILGDKVAAGVPVYLISDRNQTDGWYDTTEDRLRDVGVVVYEATNDTTEFTAMHHKVAVLGRTDIRVITDAANWTKSGLGSSTSKSTNIESSLFVEPWHDEGRTGERYLAQFMRVLERYADQGAPEGEPGYDEVAERLLAQPGWPTSEVSFVLDEGHTSWGETMRVVGDQSALGMWGADSLGVPLWTDGDLYPTWMPAASASLPVGVPFEFKFVAEQWGAFRWESGDNRTGFVQPPVHGTQELRGSWK